MTNNRVSSSKAPTDLARIFAQRSGYGDLDGVQAIRHHVARLRSAVGTTQIGGALQSFLTARGIEGPETVSDLQCDGYLEPKGRFYDRGFRMVLRSGTNKGRIRFTTAHEVCHTFFYELVPELKFSAHHTDLDEERLCNEGAAELLMPTDRIMEDADDSSESIQSLVALASRYAVSLDAMLLRLREIKSWTCALSIWHRMTTGRFVLERLRGGQTFNWRWVDESIINRAWDDPKRRTITGRTAIDFQDATGNEFARIVYFEMQRRGDYVVALWSKRKLGGAEAPLFRHARRRTLTEAPRPW